MTVIKGTTKKGENLLNSAKNFEGFTLEEVYGRYSDNKYRAYRYCADKCMAENGHNFHICSHNTFQFSVAWEVENGVRIETANNSYLITY